MAERTATIRLFAAGGERVRAVMQGLTTQVRALGAEQRRSSDTAKRASDEATRARTRGEQQVASAVRTAADEEVRAATRRARETVRAAEDSARARVRITQRRLQQEDRDEEAASQRRRRQLTPDEARSRRGQAIAAAGGVALGGAMALYGRASSTAQIGSLEERIAAAGNFGTALLRFGAAADISGAQRDAIGQQIVATSDRTGIRSGELLAGLESAQSRFGPQAAVQLSGMLDELGSASVATGSSVEDLIGLLGTVGTAYRLSEDELREFLNSTVQATREGSIDARDFAGNFASSLALFAETTGRRGISGAREAVGLAEVIGSGQFGAAESATRFEALIRQLSDAGVQQRFRAAGVQVADRRTGAILPLEQIAANVAGSRRLQTARGLSSLQLDSRAESALLILRSRAEGLRQFAGADATTGSQYVRDASREILGSQYSQLTRIGTRRENDTIRNADETIAAYRETVDALSSLEARFPILSSTMGTLTSTLQAFLPALLVSSAAGGGGLGGALATGAGGLAARAGMATLGAGGLAAAAPSPPAPSCSTRTPRARRRRRSPARRRRAPRRSTNARRRSGSSLPRRGVRSPMRCVLSTQRVDRRPAIV